MKKLIIFTLSFVIFTPACFGMETDKSSINLITQRLVTFCEHNPNNRQEIADIVFTLHARDNDDDNLCQTCILNELMQKYKKNKCTLPDNPIFKILEHIGKELKAEEEKKYKLEEVSHPQPSIMQTLFGNCFAHITSENLKTTFNTLSTGTHRALASNFSDIK